MSETIRVHCGHAPNDKPGWFQLPLGVAYNVRLDGVEVRSVVAADSIDGELWRHTGKIVAGDFEIEKLSGAVEIERAA